MNIAISPTTQAFDAVAIGSRVHDFDFMKVVSDAVKEHDSSKDRVPGQHFIVLPERAKELVSAGVGKHTHNPDDYVVREWRGQASLFLKRDHAAECTGCAVEVYTWDAFISDPQVSAEMAKEIEAKNSEPITHVLVAVLAFGGPEASPVSPHRFVENLAGGNKEYETYSKDELVKLAHQVKDYHNEWCVVAD